MLFSFRLLLSQIKSYIRSLPGIIIGAVIFVSLITSIYYGTTALLSDTEEIEKGTVAVITNNVDDYYVRLALSYLSSMKSTSMAFEFKEMDYEKAYSNLKKGNVIAVIEFPDNAIDSILTGENKPVDIIFNDSNPLSNVFLTEITKAGANFLGAAQAGTFTTADVYRDLELTAGLGSAYNDVDNIGYKFILKRQSMFDYEDTDETYSQTLLFYTASGIILIMMLVGITFLRNAFPDEDVIMMFGCRLKLFGLRYYIPKFISLFLIYWGFAFASFKLIAPIYEMLELKYKPDLIYTVYFALFVTSLVMLCAYIMPTLKDSIILLFILAVALELLSGLIIPAAFLPSGISGIIRFMPFTYLHSLAMYIMGINSELSIVGCIIYILVFILTSYLGLIFRLKKTVS